MSQSQDRLSIANGKFALDLYKFHASPSDQNIFMSPLSVSVALAMTYLGARGQTRFSADLLLKTIANVISLLVWQDNFT